MNLYYKITDNKVAGVVTAEQPDETLKLIDIRTTPASLMIANIGLEWDGTKPVKKIDKHMTKLQFNSRFTLQELAAIKSAQGANPILQVLDDRLKIADYIDVTDPATIQGVQYLVSVNLLTTERAADILA